MMSIPKLTLDNNCVINLFDRNSVSATSVDELNELLRMGFSGKIEVSVTTRVEADLAQDKDLGRRNEIMRMVQIIPVVGTVARWGTTKWGVGDIWGGGSISKLGDELQKLLFPGGIDTNQPSAINKINDIDHLIGHFINKRDIFVTDDKGILKKNETLKNGFGIIVMTPAQVLSFLEKLENSAKPITLDVKNVDSNYHSKPHKGLVSFDYSNNDGKFVLGDGVFGFETKWSKASDTSIHAYKDGTNIVGLALAKGIVDLSEISSLDNFDYSSRVRTPSLGQIVIFKNINGHYAAVKIIEIKDDSRGAPEDLLTLEYKILNAN